MDVYILHETQESSLCGQHCLNNLVQQTSFDAVSLAEIAQQLDEEERRFMLEGTQQDLLKFLGQESGNVDSAGNFSVEVLRCALKRSYEIDLISWTGSEGRSHADPTDEMAFIVNRSNHWFTIRKIGEHWWNLDSLAEKPSHISPFYLTAFLGQLRDEGFTIFLARGNIPAGGTYLYNSSDYIGAIWHMEASLLGRDKQSTRTVVASSTPGVPVDDDEDMMLAMAISASLA